MIIPLSPFIHKMHWTLMVLVALTFIASTLYSFFAFPFSPSDPLKVYFKQTIDLDANITQVNLQAVPMYLRHQIIDEIPAVGSAKDVWCTDNGLRADLKSCSYNASMPAVAGPNMTLSDLVTYSAKRHLSLLPHPDKNHTWVQFKVKGMATRGCRIYFESAAKPIELHVAGASHNGSTQPGFPIPPEGASQLRLWSRTWDREFVVNAKYGDKVNSTTKIEGRVACEWAENLDSRIPGLEEVETFLPKWAVVTKMDDGLVEAWWKFSV